MRIGHILVCHSVEPTKLFASVPHRGAGPWYVFLHSGNAEVRRCVGEAMRDRPGQVLAYGVNRGLAKSWNEGIRLALGDGCDGVMLLNDDLFFYEGGYAAFLRELESIASSGARTSFITPLGLESGASPHAGSTISQNFACCFLPRSLIDAIGYFDENFFPAYFEDTDYYRRAALSHLHAHVVRDVLVEHERSKTERLISAEEKDHLRIAMEENKKYFERKWGGYGGSETFMLPFGGKFDLTIPVERSAAPYGPGFDRVEERSMSDADAVPTGHFGSPYTDFMAVLSEQRKPKRYLEVGVSTGNLLQHIRADHVIGVDPSFAFNVNMMGHKRRATFFQTTSDDFFSTETATTLGGTVDLAFLDGMHTFEFLLRDFFKTERLCSTRSLIVMHDCMPLNEEMAHRNFGHSLQIGRDSKFPNYWTGDVWKIVPILQKYRPDLRIFYVDAPPTGLVCVTNLDPSSEVLEEKYLDIVDEMRATPNALAEIEKMYRSIEITPTSALMTDFDQSLFFRM